MDALFGKTIKLLSNVLSFRAERQKVISSNVANIDSEGYRPSELSFSSDLAKAMGGEAGLPLTRTDPRHLTTDGGANADGEFQVTTSKDKVNLDTEMANLAENHLMYNLTVELLARKFRSLQNVIKESR